MPAKPRSTSSFSTGWKDISASGAAMKRFEESFAKDMGVELTRTDHVETPKVIPTGSLMLDRALGIGGYPVGRIIQIWGGMHVGKTTSMILAMIEAQKLFPNKMVALVDPEQTFDEGWAVKLGLDLKRLWRPKKKPHTAEEVADMTKRFVYSGMCSIVGLDSIGAMISRPQFDKEADEASVIAAVAKVTTRLVQTIHPMGVENNTTTIINNQVRSAINSYGSPQTRTGGNALDHLSSIMLHERAGQEHLNMIIDGEEVQVGQQVICRVQKNKLASPGAVASFRIINRLTDRYGPYGVDKAAEAAALGIRMKLWPGNGSWFNLPDGTKVNGEPNLVKKLRDLPSLIEEVRALAIAESSKTLTAQDGDDELADEMAAILEDESA